MERLKLALPKHDILLGIDKIWGTYTID
jgi:hypothetical protein